MNTEGILRLSAGFTQLQEVWDAVFINGYFFGLKNK